MSRRRVLASAAAGVVVAAVATALVALDLPSEPVVKDEAFIDAETAGVLTIEGGECFTDPAYSKAIDAVEVVYTECVEADNQAFAFFELTDGPWSHERVAREARAGCRTRFERTWTGADRSGLDFYPVLPTELSWEYGDHDVMCAVYRPDGVLAESVIPRG